MPAVDAVELVETLVGFDTTSRDSNLALIAFVETYLADLGIASVRVASEDGAKANLFATVGPAETPGIVLSGHTDVVPVDGQEWDTDPFTVERRDGRLYGRGTCDMKSFIAVALAHAPRFAAADLRVPIHFALSYDEEVGCIGVRRLLDMMAGLPVRPAMCIVGEPTEMKVVVGHKGQLGCQCHVRGLEAHSSLAPRAVNAIEYAAELIHHLRLMAERIRTQGPFDAEYDVPHTTVHTGVIKGGTALNIVPRDCRFLFEFRCIAQDDPADLLDEVVRFAREELEPQMKAVDGACGFTFEERSSIPGLSTGPDEEVVRLAKALTRRNDHGKVAFGTEAGLFQRQAGIPTVVCGPGSIAQAHKPNEFVELAQIEKCDDFMDRLLAEVCAPS